MTNEKAVLFIIFQQMKNKVQQKMGSNNTRKKLISIDLK
jgi:hypothetical protein